jgi:murein DD-endopeptidase MepM/ murein hydrolase activator NlpD
VLPVLLELPTIVVMRRRPNFLALVVALAIALVTLVTIPLAGSGVAQQTEKQRKLAQEIDETSRAADQARAQALEFQAQRAKLDATLGSLQVQVVAATDALTAAQAEVDRLGFEAFVLGVDITKTQQQLAAAEAEAKAAAVLLYKRPDSQSIVNLIGSADGSGSIVEGKHYLERVNEMRRADMARAERLRKKLAQQQTDLDAQQQQASDARAAAETAKEQIDTLVAQQASASASAAQAQAGFEASASVLASEQEQLESEKAVEDAKVRELLASAGDGPPMGNGQFLKPVGGAPITSGFGYRSDPISGASSFHAGIDFGASCGTPIKAAGNGVVVSASWMDGYGNGTIVNHGGGMATLYGHQSGFAVSAGQTVSAGQVIGYVGSTGKSTGCHLHFEVRISGNPVDPRAYL